MPITAYPAIAAPSDVSGPPADATRTASGLASKVLKVGTGQDHPGQNDSVTVDFTGWTTDGKLFDSSVAPPLPGGKPAPVTVALTRVIPGWAEGVQLMTVGETRRLWIPEELANKGRPQEPSGMLVFDIELLGISRGPTPPADVAAAPLDAQVAKSGLASKVIQPGSGILHPRPIDGVRVNYSIWQPDGKLIEGSSDKPVARPVAGAFEGWNEALGQMVEGEKRMFWVPADLAARDKQGSTRGNVTMVIELLQIVGAPDAPTDIEGPAKDARIEEDGLATQVVAEGTGSIHPTLSSRVTVQYAGWTTDGKMFDASYSRGEAASFDVRSLIPGWREALQLMVVGEKRRMWIPEALAYKNQADAPRGMLVFEVELLKIADALGQPQRGSQRETQATPWRQGP